MRRDKRRRTVGPCVLTSLHSCLTRLAKTPLIAAPSDSSRHGHECSTQMREGAELVFDLSWRIAQRRRSVNQQLADGNQWLRSARI